jgi:phosphoribosylformimino-5-aminoimidazole carboxamide ribotide isomerase
MTSQPETFQVIPAVDILGTEAVRLLRGDYDDVTLREADPFALIERVAAAGAEIVHVVDLSAARAGGVRPGLVARAVAAASPARVQAAGGVRSTSDAAALVAAGAERVVVGTAAFSNSSLLDELVRELGTRLVVAIDVRAGAVAVDGWTRGTSFSAPDAVERATQAGASRLLCTAIERDGTLGGPSLDLLAEVCALSGLPVLAAGGIRSPDDLRAIEAVGCEGAIVGRGLLEGLVPLATLGSRGDE